MTETAFLKLFVAIVITFILVLPEFFKTPKVSSVCPRVLFHHMPEVVFRFTIRWKCGLFSVLGSYNIGKLPQNSCAERTRELSCLEVCFLPNFTSPLSSFNFSSVAFLQPAEEIQTIMGISPNHSSFQSFAEICRGITSRLPMCSLCLVCESKGDVDFTSQEQTSKGLVMRGSTEVTASDLSSPCQYFNITAALIADPVKEDNTTCTPETRPGKASAVDEDLARKKSLNHTCRFMRSTNNCAHIFLRLETDVKPVTCSMKITWYILVLLVFMLSIIFIIHKILEDHRRVRRWQSHKYKSTSGLLRGGGSVKLSTLSMRVIPESTQRLPLVRVMEELPPIPELEVASAAHQQDQYTPLFLDNLD